MEQNHQNLKLPEGIESGGMQKPHKANLLKKVLMLIVASSMFAIIGISHGHAQTPIVDFIAEPDTATVGSPVRFDNQSLNIDTTNSYFVWQFEQCNSVDISVFVVSDTTNSFNDVSFVFMHHGVFQVKLTAFANNGTIIGVKTEAIIVKIDLASPLLCSIPDSLCDIICNGTFESYEGTIDHISLIEPNVYCWNKYEDQYFGCMLGSSFCNEPLTGTPDYYNASFYNPGYFYSLDVPNNSSGTQYSHGAISPSDGYAGIITYDEKNIHNYAPSDYKEYLYQKLAIPLIQGSRYTVTFYFSLADSSAYASPLGVMFSMDQVCQPTYTQFGATQYGGHITPPVNSQVYTISSDINDWNYDQHLLLRDYNWYRFDTSFIAQDNYQFITIGNFGSFGDNRIIIDGGQTFPQSDGTISKLAYYYIDDVSLFQDSVDIGPNPNPICIGSTTTLDASETYDQYWTAFPTDTSLIGQEYDSIINVSPLDTTIYTLHYNNVCEISDTVFVAGPLPTPIINGNHNNCDLNTEYEIENPQANCNYRWDIRDPLYSSPYSFPQYGPDSIFVQWNNLWQNGPAESTWLIVTVVDTISGCSSVDSIRIWKCCQKGTGGYINDTTVTSNSVFSSGKIFNGDIIINAPMSVVAQRIYMGPEARIIVNPTVTTFVIDSCQILASCNYMWDGIYISDSNTTVTIKKNSQVRDALNAVVSDKGGKFVLSGSQFYDNYISVLVRNYFFLPGHNWPKHKGRITGCTFSYKSGCFAPYLGERPKFGIYADNVFALTVGDSASASLKNTFKNLYCGIYSFQSRLNIFNNRFTNIKTPSGTVCNSSHGDFAGLYCEAAIHYVKIYNDANHYNSSILVLGGNCLNSRNVFDTCTTGVYTYQTVTKINNCKFNNTASGVYCRDILSPSYVLNSKFTSTVSKGISCVNTLPANISLNIKYDTIYDPLNGIYVSNISSHPTIPNLRVIISNNNIQLNRSSGVMYGIRLENANRVLANCNNIYRPSRPTVANRLNVRGFQVEQSISDTLRSNTTTNLGIGIKGAGSLLGTQFKCNTSSYNYNGFYFDAAYNLVQSAISQQGDLTHPTDNSWYPFSTYWKIDGTLAAPLISWYYRNSAPYIPNENPILFPSIGLTATINPIAVNCSPCSVGTYLAAGSNSGQAASISGINNAEIENIINESNNYNELDESFKYFEKQYAYNVLYANSSTLNAQTTEFFNDLNYGNIGSFEKVYCLIQRSSIDSARILNDLISPSNQLELNRKRVNKVYLDYVEPQLIIPQAVINDLEVLASSSPYKEGDAVYTARAIVGYIEPVASPKSMEQETDVLNTMKVVVYPNPAENKITVEIVGLREEWCNFVLRNTLGVCVLEKAIISSGSAVTIDISKLNNGFYLYELFSKEKVIIDKGRLIISK